MSLRPAILDRHVAAVGPSELAQSPHESGGPVAPGRGRTDAEESDDRPFAGLLRPRGDRPRRRAAEQRDEVAASHSITSSARTSNEGGTSKPSAFAVLRLRIVSYLVGACTGKSATLAPRRIRST